MNEVSGVRMCPSERVVAAAASVRLFVEADRRAPMKTSIEVPRRMSAQRIEQKLERVERRIAGGDYQLRPFRDSLRRQLRAIARRGVR